MIRYLSLFLSTVEPAEFNATAEIFQMLLSLGGIICIVLVASFLFKRVLQKRVHIANQSGTIKILESRALNPKCTIYLIEVLGKTMIVGESPSGLSALGELSEDTDLTSLILAPKPVRVNKFSFASILKNKVPS